VSNMASEETLSSKLIFSGRAVKLRVDTVRLGDGRETTREIVEHEDCVAIVAVDGGEILLVRQFREAVGQALLEIPAGGIDPGETPEEAVRREMREETGFLPGKVAPIGGFYSSPGYSNEYLYLYLATELVSSPLRAEDTDSIVLVRATPQEVLELIQSGGIVDAKSIAGLLSYFERRKTY
jgi:ADP-ribose pyrophosphatase